MPEARACHEVQLRIVDGRSDGDDRRHFRLCTDCRAFASFAQEIPELIDAEGSWRPSAGGPETDASADDRDAVADLWSADPDRYDVGDVVVRGGMGTIRKAWDRRLRRPVAVKELRSRGAGAERRFVREALVTARLQHPAVVPIYEAGRAPGGRPFYVMRMVAGRSLDEVIRDAGSLPARLALLPNVITVADAVAYAHSRGVLHRDLKPANVLVGPFGETVVIDWGLAKDLGAESLADAPEGPDEPAGEGLTVAGSVLGTPAYMSPEQAGGGPVDARTDIYALGALLYHVLAGEPPYRGRSGEVLAQVRAGPSRALDVVEPQVSPDLATIVRKAMAARPDDRFRTAEELADELRRWQAGQPVRVHHYSPAALAGRWIRRHRRVVAAAAVGLLALVVTATVGLRRIVQEEETARSLSWHLLLEQGRHELLSGRPERSLVVLREVHRAGHRSAALAFLFGRLGSSLPVATLRGRGPLTCARFSPDGARIAMATRQGEIEVWEASEDARRLFVLKAGAADVSSIAFSPDGRHLLSASLDGTAAIWDLALRVRTVRLAGHAGAAWAAAYRPDGGAVLTAGADGTAAIWDARSGARLHVLRGHTEDVLSAAYDPGGRRVVTASRDTTARVWDAESGTERLRLRHRLGHVRDAAFSPDGSALVTVGPLWWTHPLTHLRQMPREMKGEYPVLFWSADGGEGRPLLGHTDLVNAAAFDPSGGVLVTAGEDETVRIWDVATGEPMGLWVGHSKAVRSVAYRPDGRRVATASHDHTVRLWDVAERSALHAWRISSVAATTARYDRAGNRLVAGQADGRLAVIDAARGTIEHTLRHPHGITLSAFSGDGGRIVTGDARGTVRTWDAASGVLASSFAPGPSEARLLDLGRDGSVVVSSGTGGTTLKDVAGGAGGVRLPVDAIAARLSPDGTRLVTAGAGGIVEIWDTRSAGRVCSLPHPQGLVQQVAYSPDGRRIVTAGWDETARLWDAADGTFLVALAGHRKGVRAADFSPDGAFVATGSGDRTVKIWDAETGNLLASYEGHRHDVLDVCYSPDGSRLVSAGGDGVLRVWNTRLADRALIERLGRLDVPWRLLDGRLIPGPPDASARP